MISINVIVILFLITVLILGLKTKSESNSNSYIFVGRKLTLIPFIATLVSTWYGGILEIGRYSFENGITTWIIFGVTYYFAAYIFSYYIVPKIIDKNVQTIPKYFNKNYGQVPSMISIIIILFITSPAPYLKILADIFQYLWDIPYLTALIFSSIFSILYIFNGGFKSIVKTDKIQFILMYLGFITILITAYFKYGGLNYLLNNAPEYAFKIPGNLNWSTIFVWGMIALVTFIDPSFYQRTFAGQSVKTVQKGIKISILCWIVFDGLTIFTGIYASAILSNPINTNPYLLLSENLLPPIFQGLFIISLMSIIMSTIDSFSFISAYTIGIDLSSIYKFNLFKSLNTKQKTQFGIVITSIISIVIAYHFEFVIDIWYTSGSFAVAVLLIPMLLALNNKKLPFSSLNMISSFSATMLWFIYGMLNNNYGYPIYPLNIEPMYPGLIISIIIWITCEFIIRFISSKN